MAGTLNTEADEMSRKQGNDYLEWSLDQSVFDMLKLKRPKMEIASRLIFLLPCNV